VELLQVRLGQGVEAGGVVAGEINTRSRGRRGSVVWGRRCGVLHTFARACGARQQTSTTHVVRVSRHRFAYMNGRWMAPLSLMCTLSFDVMLSWFEP
jgi:hypothetical protein